MTQDYDALDPKARYYDAGGIEVFDILKAKLTPEQWVGFLLGNVIKYTCRLNHKGCADSDARKVRIYSNLLADLIGDDATLTEALLVSATTGPPSFAATLEAIVDNAPTPDGDRVATPK